MSGLHDGAIKWATGVHMGRRLGPAGQRWETIRPAMLLAKRTSDAPPLFLLVPGKDNF